MKEYSCHKHGTNVRIYEKHSGRRGTVVDIVETAPEWIVPKILWDGQDQAKLQDYNEYLFVDMPEGTPKNIRECVRQQMCLSLQDFESAMVEAFKDYLAQKFSVAYLNTHDQQELKRIENLYQSIIREEK